MANVKKVLETEVNGLKVKLLEYDVESEESVRQIKEYLVNKVKISKVHNTAEYDLTYFVCSCSACHTAQGISGEEDISDTICGCVRNVFEFLLL